ncbi:Protein PBDC1 [Armadillidium vulgare]|nr:Protein PBDC1 [Armadillidium vulgare]
MANQSEIFEELGLGNLQNGCSGGMSQVSADQLGNDKWRPFCSKFEKEIEDFSFATLVRLNCEEDYTEENTILVTRIQFFCIEISRNREGLNDNIRNKFKPKPRTKCKA